GYLLIAGQPSLEQLVCIRDCDEAETREEHTDRNDPSSGSVHTLSPFPFVLVVRGATASELLGPDRACHSGKRLSAHVFSFDRTSVPAAESMPPMPLTSESLTFGTWRGPVAEGERPDRGQSARAASNGASCPDAGRVDRGVRKEGPAGGGRIFRCGLDAFRVRIDPSLQRRKRSDGPIAPQLALPEAQLAAGPHTAFGQGPLSEESRQGTCRSSC